MSDRSPLSATDTRPFFVIAIAICTVALLAPALAALGVLAGPPEAWMAGAPLAVFSPTIAAVIAARREGGWPAVRAVLRGLRAVRVAPVWWIVALLLPTAVFVAARAIHGLVVEDTSPWLYPPHEPERIAAMFIVPIGEEIGWRGYALPRLLARHGAHRASAILGVLWALWHVPMFLASGWLDSRFFAGLVLIAAGGVVYTWHYRRSGGSLLLAVLFHVGAHLNNPTLVDDATPSWLYAIAFVVLALALLLLDRRAFEGTTPEAPGTPLACSAVGGR